MGTQFRAECSYCGCSQAVESDMTRSVLHGYKRPGDGYIFGRCHGAHRPHFGTPEGRELARVWGEEAKAGADALTLALPAAQAKAAPWEALRAEMRSQYTYRGHDAHVDAKIAHECKNAWEWPGVIRMNLSYAREQAARVAKWTEKAPVEVKVKKGKLTHWRRGNSYNPPCVRSYRIGNGSRNYDTTPNAGLVNCPKCVKIIAGTVLALRAHAEGKHVGFGRVSYCPTCVAERTAERTARG